MAATRLRTALKLKRIVKKLERAAWDTPDEAAVIDYLMTKLKYLQDIWDSSDDPADAVRAVPVTTVMRETEMLVEALLGPPESLD